MNKKTTLILGDTVAIAVLTIIGFATHGEADVSFIPRMGTTFFPVLVSWLLAAPWFGLFDEQVTVNFKYLWRILPAMIFVAPLAVLLRAMLLHSAAQPLFALVMGGSNALGVLVWRAVYLFIAKRDSR
jgi:hypothetical protein